MSYFLKDLRVSLEDNRLWGFLWIAFKGYPGSIHLRSFEWMCFFLKNKNEKRIFLKLYEVYYERIQNCFSKSKYNWNIASNICSIFIHKTSQIGFNLLIFRKLQPSKSYFYDGFKTYSTLIFLFFFSKFMKLVS